MRRTMLKSKIRAMQVNGAAARLVHPGDTIIVISYADYDADELDAYSPTVVHVDHGNAIITVDAAVDELHSPAAQVDSPVV